MSRVIVSSVAVGIPFNNTTNGFTASNVQTGIEEARTTVLNSSVTATSNTTTSSGTDSIISGMTITPVAGTYFVIYSGEISTNGANNSGEVSLYTGATRVTHSVRTIAINVALLLGIIGTSTVTMGAGHTMAVVTVDGVTAITAQFKRTNGAGTLTVAARSMTSLRIG